MESLKNTKIGIAIVSAFVAGGATGALLFGNNNISNEAGNSNTSIKDNSNQTLEKLSDDLSLEEKVIVASKSKFVGNRHFFWSSENVIYKTPKYSGYIYDLLAERVVSNDTRVSSEGAYHVTVALASTVSEYERSLNPSDQIYEETYNRFVEGYDKLSAQVLKPNPGGGYRPVDEEYMKVINEYFASDDKNLINLKEAMQIIPSGKLVPDMNSLHMKKTGNTGVYAFEITMNRDEDDAQVMYITGYYTVDVKYFTVTATEYLYDGAVLKDQFTLNLNGGQQSVNN